MDTSIASGVCFLKPKENCIGIAQAGVNYRAVGCRHIPLSGKVFQPGKYAARLLRISGDTIYIAERRQKSRCAAGFIPFDKQESARG